MGILSNSKRRRCAEGARDTIEESEGLIQMKTCLRRAIGFPNPEKLGKTHMFGIVGPFLGIFTVNLWKTYA